MHSFDDLTNRCRAVVQLGISRLSEDLQSDQFAIAQELEVGINQVVPPEEEITIDWFLQLLESRPDLFSFSFDAGVSSVQAACRQVVVDAIFDEIDDYAVTEDLDPSFRAF